MSLQDLIAENKDEWLSEVRHFLKSHSEADTEKWIVEGLQYLGRDYHGREYPDWECESAADQLIDEVRENELDSTEDAGTGRAGAADGSASRSLGGDPGMAGNPWVSTDLPRIG